MWKKYLKSGFIISITLHNRHYAKLYYKKKTLVLNSKYMENKKTSYYLRSY